METFWTRPRAWAALGSIILLALLLRLPGVASSQAPDETFSYDIYARGGVYGMFILPYQCNNQPLNTFAGWVSTGIFGDSDWAMRLPALLAGLAMLPVAYAFCLRALGARAAGLAAALGLAVHLPHIAYSANFRSYTLVMLFALLTTWQLYEHLRKPQWRYVAGIATTTFLMAFSHIVALILLAGWGLCLLGWLGWRWRAGTWRNRESLLGFVGGGVALALGLGLTCIAYLPAFNLPMALVERILTGAWPPDALSFVSGAEQKEWFAFALFTNQVTSLTGVGFWVFAVAAVTGCLALARTRPGAALLLTCLLGPVAALLITGLKIEPRYSVVLAPLFACALGAGVAWMANWKWPLSVGALALYCFAAIYPYATGFPDAGPSFACVWSSTKPAMDSIASQAAPRDLVVIDNNGDACFDHYADKMYNRQHAALEGDGPVRLWTTRLLGDPDWTTAYGVGAVSQTFDWGKTASVEATLAAYRPALLPPLAAWTASIDRFTLGFHWPPRRVENVAATPAVDGDTTWFPLEAGFNSLRVRVDPVACAPGRLASFQVQIYWPHGDGDVNAQLRFVKEPGQPEQIRVTREARPGMELPEGWRLLRIDALTPEGHGAVYAEVGCRVHVGAPRRIGLRDAKLLLDAAP